MHVGNCTCPQCTCISLGVLYARASGSVLPFLAAPEPADVGCILADHAYVCMCLQVDKWAHVSGAHPTL